MSVTGTLAALALRYAFNESAEKVVSTVKEYFADHSQLLPDALVRANDRAWKAVGLAIAGNTLFDRVRGWSAGGEMVAMRDQLRTFIENTPTGLDAVPGELRASACDELNRLRKSGRLALKLNGSEVASDIRRYSDPSKLAGSAAEAVAAVADALTADAPNLAQVLRLAPPGAPPLLAVAFLYFFRREVETTDELARGLTFDALRGITADQERGLRLLDDRTAGILDQFDALFGALAEVLAGIVNLGGKVDTGFSDVKAEFADVKAVVKEELQKIGEQLTKSRKSGVSYDDERERRLLLGVRQKYRKNPDSWSSEEWGNLAGVMSKAGLFAEASEAHENAASNARAVRDTAAEAANHYKAYLDECDARAWSQAFDLLWKAVELEAARYTPFDHNRYKPERILGGGAFGTVFLCHDEYDRDDDGQPRPVAIKSFRTEAGDRDLTQVFAEARTLKALGHPSIIGVIDRGFGNTAARTRPYLVLEYFPGQTLDQYIASFGPLLPVPDFLAVARQIAEAIHAAHTRPRPIYHRDLKPSNVMVLRNPDGSWVVKVIDFGLAVGAALVKAGALVPLASRSTREKSVTGTSKYAPPEQLGELPGVEVGPYSDVYAFGKTCLDAILRTVAPKSWHWKSLPGEYREPLQELLERCTADAIEHRYPSFEPVLAGLSALESVERMKLERLERESAEQTRQAEEAERARVAEEVKRKQQADQAERVRIGAEATRIATEKKAREEAERREAEISRSAVEKQTPNLDRQRIPPERNRIVKEWQDAVKRDTTSAWACLKQGNAMYAKADMDGAEIAYRKAIQFDPAYYGAHIGLGNVLRSKGDLAGAEAAYKEAIGLSPTDAGARSSLGNALIER